MSRLPYGEWTAERVALLIEIYPHHGAGDHTMGAINALPGRPFTKHEALVYKASTIGLRLTKEAHKRRMMEGIRKADAAAKRDTTPTFSNGFRHAPLAPVPAPDLPPAEQAEIADAKRVQKEAKAARLLRPYVGKPTPDLGPIAASAGVKLLTAHVILGMLRAEHYA